jgi:hypothetical protein
MHPPMQGIGPNAAAPSWAQARAIPPRPIDDHEGPQPGHEARTGEPHVRSGCAAVHIPTGDAGRRLSYLRECAEDWAAVQFCSDRPALGTDAEATAIRRSTSTLWAAQWRNGAMALARGSAVWSRRWASDRLLARATKTVRSSTCDRLYSHVDYYHRWRAHGS